MGSHMAGTWFPHGSNALDTLARHRRLTCLLGSASGVVLGEVPSEAEPCVGSPATYPASTKDGRRAAHEPSADERSPSSPPPLRRPGSGQLPVCARGRSQPVRTDEVAVWSARSGRRGLVGAVWSARSGPRGLVRPVWSARSGPPGLVRPVWARPQTRVPAPGKTTDRTRCLARTGRARHRARLEADVMLETQPSQGLGPGSAPLRQALPTGGQEP